MSELFPGEHDNRFSGVATVGAYGADDMRQQLRSVVRSVWDSPSGHALAQQLRASVPRQQMSQNMQRLRRPIHDALAPLGPSISQAFRSAWGSLY